ncbi:MAG: DUF6019 family protein [Desulfitobacterium sp.]
MYMFIAFLFGMVCFALYMIIKTAVKNGVKEAIENQEAQLQGIKDLLFALVKDKYSDNGGKE